MSAWKSWADAAQESPDAWANRYWLSYRRAEHLTELLSEQACKVSSLMGALVAARAETAELSEQLEASENEREQLEASSWPAARSA